MKPSKKRPNPDPEQPAAKGAKAVAHAGAGGGGSDSLDAIDLLFEAAQEVGDYSDEEGGPLDFNANKTLNLLLGAAQVVNNEYLEVEASAGDSAANLAEEGEDDSETIDVVSLEPDLPRQAAPDSAVKPISPQALADSGDEVGAAAPLAIDTGGGGSSTMAVATAEGESNKENYFDEEDDAIDLDAINLLYEAAQKVGDYSDEEEDALDFSANEALGLLLGAAQEVEDEFAEEAKYLEVKAPANDGGGESGAAKSGTRKRKIKTQKAKTAESKPKAPIAPDGGGGSGAAAEPTRRSSRRIASIPETSEKDPKETPEKTPKKTNTLSGADDATDPRLLRLLKRKAVQQKISSETQKAKTAESKPKAPIAPDGGGGSGAAAEPTRRSSRRSEKDPKETPEKTPKKTNTISGTDDATDPRLLRLLKRKAVQQKISSETQKAKTAESEPKAPIAQDGGGGSGAANSLAPAPTAEEVERAPKDVNDLFKGLLVDNLEDLSEGKDNVTEPIEYPFLENKAPAGSGGGESSAEELRIFGYLEKPYGNSTIPLFAPDIIGKGEEDAQEAAYHSFVEDLYQDREAPAGAGDGGSGAGVVNQALLPRTTAGGGGRIDGTTFIAPDLHGSNAGGLRPNSIDLAIPSFATLIGEGEEDALEGTQETAYHSFDLHQDRETPAGAGDGGSGAGVVNQALLPRTTAGGGGRSRTFAGEPNKSSNDHQKIKIFDAIFGKEVVLWFNHVLGESIHDSPVSFFIKRDEKYQLEPRTEYKSIEDFEKQHSHALISKDSNDRLKHQNKENFASMIINKAIQLFSKIKGIAKPSEQDINGFFQKEKQLLEAQLKECAGDIEKMDKVKGDFLTKILMATKEVYKLFIRNQDWEKGKTKEQGAIEKIGEDLKFLNERGLFAYYDKYKPVTRSLKGALPPLIGVEGRAAVASAGEASGAATTATTFPVTKDVIHKDQELFKIAKDGTDLEKIPELIANRVDINATENFGRTALMVAICSGKVEAVKTLIKIQGIDPNKVAENGPYKGLTALMVAIIYGTTETIKALMEMPEIDVNKVVKDVTHKGLTALMIATELNKIDAIKALMEMPEIDINKAAESGPKAGMTALMIAAELGNLEAIKVLIEIPGINVNKVAESGLEKGNTALMIALKKNKKTVVRTLTQFASMPISPPPRTKGSSEAVDRDSPGPDIEGLNFELQVEGGASGAAATNITSDALSDLFDSYLGDDRDEAAVKEAALKELRELGMELGMELPKPPTLTPDEGGGSGAVASRMRKRRTKRTIAEKEGDIGILKDSLSSKRHMIFDVIFGEGVVTWSPLEAQSAAEASHTQKGNGAIRFFIKNNLGEFEYTLQLTTPDDFDFASAQLNTVVSCFSALNDIKQPSQKNINGFFKREKELLSTELARCLGDDEGASKVRGDFLKKIIEGTKNVHNLLVKHEKYKAGKVSLGTIEEEFRYLKDNGLFRYCDKYFPDPKATPAPSDGREGEGEEGEVAPRGFEFGLLGPEPNLGIGGGSGAAAAADSHLDGSLFDKDLDEDAGLGNWLLGSEDGDRLGEKDGEAPKPTAPATTFRPAGGPKQSVGVPEKSSRTT